jgi:hypothetical protein
MPAVEPVKLRTNERKSTIVFDGSLKRTTPDADTDCKSPRILTFCLLKPPASSLRLYANFFWKSCFYVCHRIICSNVYMRK